MGMYSTILVDAGYDEYKAGDQVIDLNGTVRIYGESAFASLDEAVASDASKEAVICAVESGKYSYYKVDAGRKITAVTQLVYVNFNGGTDLSYVNGEYSQSDITVEPAMYTAEQKQYIIQKLNAGAADGVAYISEEPVGEYSTVYAGATDAFDETVKGIAESNDIGNANKSDNAFVNTDKVTGVDDLVDTIEHEVEHLTGTSTEEQNGTIGDFTSSTLPALTVSGKTATYAFTTSDTYTGAVSETYKSGWTVAFKAATGIDVKYSGEVKSDTFKLDNAGSMTLGVGSEKLAAKTLTGSNSGTLDGNYEISGAVNLANSGTLKGKYIAGVVTINNTGSITSANLSSNTYIDITNTTASATVKDSTLSAKGQITLIKGTDGGAFTNLKTTSAYLSIDGAVVDIKADSSLTSSGEGASGTLRIYGGGSLTVKGTGTVGSDKFFASTSGNIIGYREEAPATAPTSNITLSGYQGAFNMQVGYIDTILLNAKDTTNSTVSFGNTFYKFDELAIAAGSTANVVWTDAAINNCSLQLFGYSDTGADNYRIQVTGAGTLNFNGTSGFNLGNGADGAAYGLDMTGFTGIANVANSITIDAEKEYFGAGATINTNANGIVNLGLANKSTGTKYTSSDATGRINILENQTFSAASQINGFSGTVNVAAEKTFTLGGANTTSAKFTGAAAVSPATASVLTLDAAQAFNADGAINGFKGDINVNSALTLGGDNDTSAKLIGTAGLNINSADANPITVKLTADNDTYTGAATVDAGDKLILAGVDANGDKVTFGAASVAVGAGATLEVATAQTLDATLSGTGIFDVNAATVLAKDAALNGFTGTLALESNALTLANDNTTAAALTGAAASSITLGTATDADSQIVLTGDASGFAGTVNFVNGADLTLQHADSAKILKASKFDMAAAGSGANVLALATTDATYTSAITGAAEDDINVNAASKLTGDINAFAGDINFANGASLTLQNSGTTPAVNAAAIDMTTDTNANVLTLATAQTVNSTSITGGTNDTVNVNAATVLAKDNVINSFAGTVAVNAALTVGSNETAASFTGASGINVAGGKTLALTKTAGAVTSYTGTVALGANSEIELDGTNTTSAKFAGASGSVIDANANQIFSADGAINGFLGDLNLEANTITLSGANTTAATITGSGVVNFNADTTLQANNGDNFTGTANIADGKTLTIGNAANNATFDAAAINLNGTGATKLVINDAQSDMDAVFTGGVNAVIDVNAATTLQTAGDLAGFSGEIQVGAALTLNGENAATATEAKFSGASAIQMNASQTLSATGALNGYSGTITLGNGTDPATLALTAVNDTAAVFVSTEKTNKNLLDLTSATTTTLSTANAITNFSGTINIGGSTLVLEKAHSIDSNDSNNKGVMKLVGTADSTLTIGGADEANQTVTFVRNYDTAGLLGTVNFVNGGKLTLMTSPGKEIGAKLIDMVPDTSENTLTFNGCYGVSTYASTITGSAADTGVAKDIISVVRETTKLTGDLNGFYGDILIGEASNTAGNLILANTSTGTAVINAGTIDLTASAKVNTLTIETAQTINSTLKGGTNDIIEVNANSTFHGNNTAYLGAVNVNGAALTLDNSANGYFHADTDINLNTAVITTAAVNFTATGKYEGTISGNGGQTVNVSNNSTLEISNANQTSGADLFSGTVKIADGSTLEITNAFDAGTFDLDTVSAATAPGATLTFKTTAGTYGAFIKGQADDVVNVQANTTLTAANTTSGADNFAGKVNVAGASLTVGGSGNTTAVFDAATIDLGTTGTFNIYGQAGSDFGAVFTGNLWNGAKINVNTDATFSGDSADFVGTTTVANGVKLTLANNFTKDGGGAAGMGRIQLNDGAELHLADSSDGKFVAGIQSSNSNAKIFVEEDYLFETNINTAAFSGTLYLDNKNGTSTPSTLTITANGGYLSSATIDTDGSGVTANAGGTVNFKVSGNTGVKLTGSVGTVNIGTDSSVNVTVTFSGSNANYAGKVNVKNNDQLSLTSENSYFTNVGVVEVTLDEHANIIFNAAAAGTTYAKIASGAAANSQINVFNDLTMKTANANGTANAFAGDIFIGTAKKLTLDAEIDASTIAFGDGTAGNATTLVINVAQPSMEAKMSSLGINALIDVNAATTLATAEALNAFTGTVNVDAALALSGDNATTAKFTGAAAINANGDLTLDNNAAQTYAQTDYTGALTIAEGKTLNVNRTFDAGSIALGTEDPAVATVMNTTVDNTYNAKITGDANDQFNVDGTGTVAVTLTGDNSGFKGAATIGENDKINLAGTTGAADSVKFAAATIGMAAGAELNVNTAQKVSAVITGTETSVLNVNAATILTGENATSYAGIANIADGTSLTLQAGFGTSASDINFGAASVLNLEDASNGTSASTLAMTSGKTGAVINVKEDYTLAGTNNTFNGTVDITDGKTLTLTNGTTGYFTKNDVAVVSLDTHNTSRVIFAADGTSDIDITGNGFVQAGLESGTADQRVSLTGKYNAFTGAIEFKNGASVILGNDISDGAIAATDIKMAEDTAVNLLHVETAQTIAAKITGDSEDMLVINTETNGTVTLTADNDTFDGKASIADANTLKLDSATATTVDDVMFDAASIALGKGAKLDVSDAQTLRAVFTGNAANGTDAASVIDLNADVKMTGKNALNGFNGGVKINANKLTLTNNNATAATITGSNELIIDGGATSVTVELSGANAGFTGTATVKTIDALTLKGAFGAKTIDLVTADFGVGSTLNFSNGTETTYTAEILGSKFDTINVNNSVILDGHDATTSIGGFAGSIKIAASQKLTLGDLNVTDAMFYGADTTTLDISAAGLTVTANKNGTSVGSFDNFAGGITLGTKTLTIKGSTETAAKITGKGVLAVVRNGADKITVTLTGDNSTFTGTTSVAEGDELNLKGSFGATSITLKNGSVLDFGKAGETFASNILMDNAASNATINVNANTTLTGDNSAFKNLVNVNTDAALTLTNSADGYFNANTTIDTKTNGVVNFASLAGAQDLHVTLTGAGAANFGNADPSIQAITYDGNNSTFSGTANVFDGDKLVLTSTNSYFNNTTGNATLNVGTGTTAEFAYAAGGTSSAVITGAGAVVTNSALTLTGANTDGTTDRFSGTVNVLNGSKLTLQNEFDAGIINLGTGKLAIEAAQTDMDATVNGSNVITIGSAAHDDLTANLNGNLSGFTGLVQFSNNANLAMTNTTGTNAINASAIQMADVTGVYTTGDNTLTLGVTDGVFKANISGDASDVIDVTANAELTGGNTQFKGNVTFANGADLKLNNLDPFGAETVLTATGAINAFAGTINLDDNSLTLSEASETAALFKTVSASAKVIASKGITLKANAAQTYDKADFAGELYVAEGYEITVDRVFDAGKITLGTDTTSSATNLHLKVGGTYNAAISGDADDSIFIYADATNANTVTLAGDNSNFKGVIDLVSNDATTAKKVVISGANNAYDILLGSASATGNGTTQTVEFANPVAHTYKSRIVGDGDDAVLVSTSASFDVDDLRTGLTTLNSFYGTVTVAGGAAMTLKDANSTFAKFNGGATAGLNLDENTVLYSNDAISAFAGTVTVKAAKELELNGTNTTDAKFVGVPGTMLDINAAQTFGADGALDGFNGEVNVEGGALTLGGDNTTSATFKGDKTITLADGTTQVFNGSAALDVYTGTVAFADGTGTTALTVSQVAATSAKFTGDVSSALTFGANAELKAAGAVDGFAGDITIGANTLTFDEAVTTSADFIGDAASKVLAKKNITLTSDASQTYAAFGGTFEMAEDGYTLSIQRVFDAAAIVLGPADPTKISTVEFKVADQSYAAKITGDANDVIYVFNNTTLTGDSANFTGDVKFDGSAALTISGNLAADLVDMANNGTYTTGANTATLNNANYTYQAIFTGDAADKIVVAANSTLDATTGAAISAFNGNITINNGVQLTLNDANTTSATFTSNWTGNSKLILNADTTLNATGSITDLQSQVTLADGVTLTLNGANVNTTSTFVGNAGTLIDVNENLEFRVTGLTGYNGTIDIASGKYLGFSGAPETTAALMSGSGEIRIGKVGYTGSPVITLTAEQALAAYTGTVNIINEDALTLNNVNTTAATLTSVAGKAAKFNVNADVTMTTAAALDGFHGTANVADTKTLTVTKTNSTDLTLTGAGSIKVDDGDISEKTLTLSGDTSAFTGTFNAGNADTMVLSGAFGTTVKTAGEGTIDLTGTQTNEITVTSDAAATNVKGNNHNLRLSGTSSFGTVSAGNGTVTLDTSFGGMVANLKGTTAASKLDLTEFNGARTVTGNIAGFNDISLVAGTTGTANENSITVNGSVSDNSLFSIALGSVLTGGALLDIKGTDNAFATTNVSVSANIAAFGDIPAGDYAEYTLVKAADDIETFDGRTLTLTVNGGTPVSVDLTICAKSEIFNGGVFTITNAKVVTVNGKSYAFAAYYDDTTLYVNARQVSDSTEVVINSQWKSLADGTLVVWPEKANGLFYVIGSSAFGDFNGVPEALAAKSGAELGKATKASIVGPYTSVDSVTLYYTADQNAFMMGGRTGKADVTNFILEAEKNPKAVAGADSGIVDAFVIAANGIYASQNIADKATTFTINNVNIAGDVFGGSKTGSKVYSSLIINNDYNTATGTTTEAVSGNVFGGTDKTGDAGSSSLTLTGGEFKGYVSGGHYAKDGAITGTTSSLVIANSKDLTVMGKTAGSLAEGTGSVKLASTNIVIDASSSGVLKIANAIYAGGITDGNGSITIDGGTNVTFSGNASKLSFTNIVSGGVLGTGTVGGTKSLTFQNFNADGGMATFRGTIKNMDVINFVGNTQVKLTARMTLTSTALSFTVTGATLKDTAMLTATTKANWAFSADPTITIKVDTAAITSGSYTLIDGYEGMVTNTAPVTVTDLAGNTIGTATWTNGDLVYNATAAGANKTIYVDFAGGTMQYNNAKVADYNDLTVTLEASSYTGSGIVAALNKSAVGVNYVLGTGTYDDAASVIYVGGTGAFSADLGSVKGLAEAEATAGADAVVNTYSITNEADLVATIAHEAGHITGEVALHGADSDIFSYASTSTEMLFAHEDTEIYDGSASGDLWNSTKLGEDLPIGDAAFADSSLKLGLTADDIETVVDNALFTSAASEIPSIDDPFKSQSNTFEVSTLTTESDLTKRNTGSLALGK